MKFSVSQKEFNQAITIVLRGVASQATLPVLGGIYIQAQGSTLTLQTCDLKVSIRHKLEAAVEEEGQTVVPGLFLSKLVKNLPDAPITMETTPTQAILTCLKSTYELSTLDASDFPEFPDITPSQSIELPSDLLNDMVERVYRVTKEDISNPILGGITLVAQENKLTMYATDSHRLVIIDTNTETASIDSEFTAIIPAVCFHELLNLPTITPRLQIGLTDNQVIFSFENTTYVSLKIEGMFPNYKNLFPTTCNTKLAVNPEQLTQAIKRVALVTTNKNLGVIFDVDPQNQLITLKADSSEFGASKEEFSATIEGNPISFSMNYQFILECCRSTTHADEMTFEIVDSFQPIVIKSFGTMNYQCLLIPLRTN